MNEDQKGTPAASPGQYYDPGYYAQNLRRYRQIHPPGAALLRVEAFDYLLVSLLRITNVSGSGIEIQAVHIDHAFPLRASVENTPAFFSTVRYPLWLAAEASLSLVLNSHAAAERFEPLGSPPPKPRKVVVTTGSGLIILELED